MLVANFLIFFAEVAFVLMASVWAKNNLTALSVALISVVAPLIVYMVVPGVVYKRQAYNQPDSLPYPTENPWG